MYGAVTPVLIDKWGPPTADAAWVGGRVYLKQILRAFPLSPLLLPGFYFFRLLFTSHRSPLSERLEQAMYKSECERCRHVCTKGAKHDGLKSHPWPTPDRWSWSTITEAWTKIQKSCWKFSRSSLKYDSASVIWWSELKIYGEQGQIKELSLKNKRRV